MKRLKIIHLTWKCTYKPIEVIGRQYAGRFANDGFLQNEKIMFTIIILLKPKYSCMYEPLCFVCVLRGFTVMKAILITGRSVEFHKNYN